MIVGIPCETYAAERRVALVPASVPSLTRAGLEVVVQPGAGESAGYIDAAYAEQGARLSRDRAEIFASDILLQVRVAGANPEAGQADIDRLKQGQIVIGMSDPLGMPDYVTEYARVGASLFSLELIPRITRAQSMDVLSSMATVAGYRAVLLAAQALPKMFPMMMTAAGTISPAKVFVVGAGVAGLQAIATAKKLGAVVSAYDVRSAVKEQVQSVGGKFIEMEIEAAGAEDKGGYAKEMDEAFYQKQRELMGRVVSQSDVVITTAVIPGRVAPILVTTAMVDGMAPGSVIVDLAAERGGNCELTSPDKAIVRGGVAVLGPTNLASDVPYHASQMFSKNITTFLLNMVKEGQLTLNLEDEIICDTLVTHEGQVVSERVKNLIGTEAT